MHMSLIPYLLYCIFTEILKLLEVGNGESRISEETFAQTQSFSLHTTPKDTYQFAGKSTSTLQSAPDLHSSTTKVTKGNNSPEMALTLNKNISFEPKVVDLEHIEKQIQESLRFVNLS